MKSDTSKPEMIFIDSVIPKMTQTNAMGKLDRKNLVPRTTVCNLF